MEGGGFFLPMTDWSCRTKQRERPKRDRLIARDVIRYGVLKIGFTFD